MKKIVTFLISCILVLPVLAIDEQSISAVSSNSTENLEIITPEEAPELHIPAPTEEEILNAPQKSINKYKAPTSKKKLIKKFIIAMACVIGTSVFLYATLSVYNKIREGVLNKPIVSQTEDEQLSSPVDLTDAVKTFIDKTHWEE